MSTVYQGNAKRKRLMLLYMGVFGTTGCSTINGCAYVVCPLQPKAIWSFLQRKAVLCLSY